MAESTHKTHFPGLPPLQLTGPLPLGLSMPMSSLPQMMPIDVQQQLQTIYALQLYQILAAGRQSLPTSLTLPTVAAGSSSEAPSPVKTTASPNSVSPSKATFSIDDLLKPQPTSHDGITGSSSTGPSPTPSLVGYTIEDLQWSDGRFKRRQSPSELLATTSEAATSSSSLSPTSLSNENQGRYRCDLCGRHYATSSNLSRHKQTHRSLDGPHAKKCDYCEKVYVSMPALSMHMKTHEAAHKCDLCGKVFSRPWLLKGHMRSHTGQKPFGCAHCGKKFADRSNLRAHMHTHTGEKKHACRHCGKLFALKSYLNKHIESACIALRDGGGGMMSSSPTPSIPF
uniref:Transcriptional repressor scratch 2 n=1 Tax=Panagrellus redivivus TaxID=6233 RepID=A0A7E4VFY3_PANRE